MKKCILLFLCVFTLTFTAKAQEGFEEVIIGGEADAKKLLEGYFAPAMEGFIYGMNNGWYHTAKVHKVLGVDLTVGLSAAMIPSAKEVFTVNGLTQFNETSYTGPTLAGDGDGNKLSITKNGTTVDITMPGGITGDLPIKAIPAPVAQFNIGLPMKFEAMVRYFPETKFGEDGGKAKMLGLGLKKEITSWFGPLDKLPLHVTLMAAYTSMDVTYGFADSTSNNITIENGNATFDLSAYTVQAIASLNFPFINIYGGLGYGKGSSSFKMLGNYTYDKGGANQETLNPPSLDFNASGFQTTVGARLSLGFFKIFGSYTLQEYNTIAAGIAISIR